MSFARQRLGKIGESLACEELQRRGYSILSRRYRTRFGEIDIIASDAGAIVFVEVKARMSGRFGDPAEAVTSQKQRRLASMAEDYLTRHHLHERPCRFDVVSVETESAAPAITLYKDAFRPGW